MAKAVGITGNIAAGKTALLTHIKTMGYLCFSCDEVVHELYSKASIQEQILELFPTLKSFNKLLLAKMIYSDPLARSKLEHFVHPLVANALELFLASNKDQSLLFLEVPLLFEAGWEKYCDFTIALKCSAKIRAERSLARGIDPEMFSAIEIAQLPEEVKAGKADFTLDTSLPWESEIQAFDAILKLILANLS